MAPEFRRHRDVPLAPREVRLVGPPPFLKWPGGKRYLVSYLLDAAPDTFNRYFEPFLGGGALFLALQPRLAYLSDANPRLVECYSAIRDDVDGVIRALRRLPNSEADYYRIRDSCPTSRASRAARLIYLSALSFNGIYRENRSGQFNVPYGGRHHRSVLASVDLYSVSACLQRAHLNAGDFEIGVAKAREGDLVYLDPPYTTAHASNGFIRYNAKLFTWEDQLRLAAVAESLARRGCHVLITNAYHPSIKRLYPAFMRYRIQRSSRVAASSRFRTAIYEYIITSYRA